MLNNAGQIAFYDTLIGSGVNFDNDQGLWWDGSGNLALAAREGNHAPGTPSGVNFGGFSSLSSVLNDAGQIAFFSKLTDGGSGIWATDRTGDLQLIARIGDKLEVAPGDSRTLSGIVFFNSSTSTGNSDGRPSAFNNLGQLAFYASFTDGSSGIFVSNVVAVPEPSALALRRGRIRLCASCDGDDARTTTSESACAICRLAATEHRSRTRRERRFFYSLPHRWPSHAAAVRTVALSGQQAPAHPAE